MNTIEGIEFVEMCVTLGLLSAGAAFCMYCFVGIMNRRVQLRKIGEINKDIQVFIREVPFVDVDEETGAIDQYISFAPHYKRPVCGDKGQEIVFIDECIISDFPEETNYQNHEQVNTLLLFWKRKHDAQTKNEHVGHPVHLFNTEEEKKHFWEHQKLYVDPIRKERMNRELNIF